MLLKQKVTSKTKFVDNLLQIIILKLYSSIGVLHGIKQFSVIQQRRHKFKYNKFKIKCWNDIPVDMKRSPSVSIFRQKLKAFLFKSNY